MICKEHYVLLKRLIIFNGTRAKDYKHRKDVYTYLLSCGYIKKADVRNYSGYVITESGRVAVDDYRKDKFRFWFPTIISIIALILSACSILIDLMKLTPQ